MPLWCPHAVPSMSPQCPLSVPNLQAVCLCGTQSVSACHQQPVGHQLEELALAVVLIVIVIVIAVAVAVAVAWPQAVAHLGVDALRGQRPQTPARGPDTPP